MSSAILPLFEYSGLSKKLIQIAEKVIAGNRISPEEGILLFREGSLSYLAVLADHVRHRINGKQVFFNRNIHLEPTNICVNHCAFCSYRRKKGEEGCWELGIGELVQKAQSHALAGITEIHIVGGVHPDRDIHFYADLIAEIKKILPAVQIKAFTAVEIDAMCRFASMDVREGLSLLKDAGLVSLPGGGAEIFDEVLRAKICPDKTDTEGWLNIHRTAHLLGIPTNSTMLYGLIEDYSHRIDHLSRLRNLQDETGGFNAFIPLKFKHYNNRFSHIEEQTTIEDLRNYAVSRIFLDNVPHLKAYWPMIGKQLAQLSLAFGVDDLDGTIDDTTKIYSMAGSEEQSPVATTDQLTEMIRGAGLTPVERDTLYNVIKVF
ncbi:MAG: aminofutalosine synthase MqnE [Prolixibacteraceae bacterium]|jgi:aminodeoxyfutalosine synthase|nr:aminofutalosine synthase MqnE [Prolixibacteraceae bacterium]